MYIILEQKLIFEKYNEFGEKYIKHLLNLRTLSILQWARALTHTHTHIHTHTQREREKEREKQCFFQYMKIQQSFDNSLLPV